MKSIVTARISSVGEDQRVVDQVGVDLLHLLLGALDRTDVVDPRGQLRGDVRLVVVVHPGLGVGLVLGQVRHQHVVAPEAQPLLRRDELDGRVVELRLDHVTGPRLAGDDVAGREVLDVLVAGERAHLTVGDHLPQRSIALAQSSSSNLLRVGADHREQEGHGVAHLGEQRDPALELVTGEQLLEALDLTGDVRVVGDARSARSATARGARSSGPTAGCAAAR